MHCALGPHFGNICHVKHKMHRKSDNGSAAGATGGAQQQRSICGTIGRSRAFKLSKEYLRDATVFHGCTHLANFFVRPRSVAPLLLP